MPNTKKRLSHPLTLLPIMASSHYSNQNVILIPREAAAQRRSNCKVTSASHLRSGFPKILLKACDEHGCDAYCDVRD
jgi:hypothetical protein